MMEYLTGLIEAWRQWALAASWQVALLAILVGVIAMSGRWLSPRARYALWLLVVIKAFLPPSLAAVWGVGHWGVRPAWERARPLVEGSFVVSAAQTAKEASALALMRARSEAVAREATTDAPPEEGPASSAPSNEKSGAKDAVSLRGGAADGGGAAQETLSAAPASPDSASGDGLAWLLQQWTFAGTLFTVWLAGGLGFLGFVLLRYWRFRRVLRGAETALEGPLRVELERLARQLGKEDAPDLLLSNRVTSPFLCGLFRARIVLPAGLPDTLDTSELRHILLHELIHWRRRDVLVGWIQLLAQALFWFHPFVWLANARARHERECACDEAAIREGQCAPKAYGESLLKVLLTAEGRFAASLGFLGVFERGARIQNRLEAIMNERARPRRLAPWGWAFLAVFALVFLPMSSKTSPAPSQPQSYAWQSVEPYLPPDFERYFPDDPEAGKRLDALVKNGSKGIDSDEEYLEAVRKGFRNTTQHRTLILSGIGNKHIWNKKEQHPLAIELMYHATDNPNADERHYAIYFGTSVVEPKTPAILRSLADIAMTTDDPNDTGRIAWGAAKQREELIKYLAPYLANEDPKVLGHAQAMKRIFSGEMDAREYWKQNRIAEAEPLFGPRMEELRARLATGDSAARRDVLDTMRQHSLQLIIRDRGAWLEAYAAAAKDPDRRVRESVGKAVGGGWVWNADEPSTRAVNVLLDLARDEDGEVRSAASYYGLSRLPKDHPAQARVQEVNREELDRRLQQMRGRVLQSIKDGKHEEVESFLNEIKPADSITYNQEGDREKVQALYDEVSAKLAEARRPGGTLQQRIDAAGAGSVIDLEAKHYEGPILIEKPMTLRGAGMDSTVIELLGDEPAVLVKGAEGVTIENLKVRWGLKSTNARPENPAAIAVRDSTVTIKGCTLEPIDRPKDTPYGLLAAGRSNVTFTQGRSTGFAYALMFMDRANGEVTDSYLSGAGHSVVTLHDNSRVKIAGNVLADCGYHAVRNSGGTMEMVNNVVTGNKITGAYLGNKDAHGTISNNLFIGNQSGVGGYYRSDVEIANNLFIDSKNEAIGFWDSCQLKISRNSFVNNPTALIQYNKNGAPGASGAALDGNHYWNNERDVIQWKNKDESTDAPKEANAITGDPEFADPAHHDLTPGETSALLKDGRPLAGLSDHQAILRVHTALMAAQDEGQMTTARQSASEKVLPVIEKSLRYSYVDDTAEGKQSLAASGHAVEWGRPEEARFLEGVEIYASRYGTPEAPKEDFHLYVLNQQRQVLADLKYPYSMIERGDMKWYTLRTPSIETPHYFMVALAFNPDRTKGIYLGYDEHAAESQSFTGLPESGFEKVDKKYDWMVRVLMTGKPSGEKGVQLLADWKPLVAADPFQGCIELKYDAGESNDKQSYGGAGPAIQLRLADFVSLSGASRDDLKLVGLRLYASRYGSGYDTEKTSVKWIILDSSNQSRKKGVLPYSLFSYKTKWVDFVLPQPLPVKSLTGDDGIMTIALYPDANQTKGIYFYYNRNPQTSHSFTVTEDGTFKPVADREWLIRAYVAVGSSAGKSSSASLPTVPPQIIATSPAVGATDVDAATTEIAVTFSCAMNTGGYSWCGAGPDYPPTQEGKRPFWRDKRTCALPVKLEAAHYYRVGINSTDYLNFQSAEGEPVDPSAIYFTTKGASEETKARTRKPEVVKMDPPNGATDVDPSLKELRVTFDVPMGSGCSWCGSGPHFPAIPEGKRAGWSDDRKTAILPVELKPNWTYYVSLNAPSFNNFASEAGVSLDPMAYRFTTRGQSANDPTKPPF